MRRALAFGLLASFFAGCGAQRPTTGEGTPGGGTGGSAGAGGSSAGTAGSGGTSGGGQGGASMAGSGASAGVAGSGGMVDLDDFIKPPSFACAYNDCPDLSKCAAAQKPYACESLGDWAQLPHDPTACPAWDGTQPAVTPGQCTASDPTGEAIRYAGPDGTGTYVLPDGRRMKPAGSFFRFDEPDLIGGLTTNLVLVPGGTLAISVDSGNGVHVVRALDTAKLDDPKGPVLASVKFDGPILNGNIAFVPPDLVLAGTAEGKLAAMKLDATAGTLVADDARTIVLPKNGTTAPYPSSLAVSADGKVLAVVTQNDTRLFVVDVESGSSTYGSVLGTADLGGKETFAVAFDGHDPASKHAYVSMWQDAKVVDVDVSTPSAPKVAGSFAVDADPEGIAFLDARWMVVANDFGDDLSLVDRMSGTVTPVPVAPDGTPHGAEPSGIAYDDAAKKLYVALAATNALAVYDVDLTVTPPTITLAGRLPTAWWPSNVRVRADGAIVIPSMRGHGSGPQPAHFDVGSGDIADRMRGGVQVVPSPSAQDVQDGESFVASSLAVGKQPGQPAVTCPPGVNDFPIPPTNDAGPSPVIKHVFFMLRENKDFDGLFGDFANVNGDATLTLKTDPAKMDEIWVNLRSLAKTFAMSDNYYTDAVYSTQGHVWATFGRTSDFDERTWPLFDSSLPRGALPVAGIATVGRPIEGSLFDWLGKNGITYDVFGEAVGPPDKADYTAEDDPSEIHYPGGPFQNILYPDVEKACYLAGRLRVKCDLRQLVYMTITNDHTGGVSSSSPSPETYCAVNDEATGMFADALSHSPYWSQSLLVITEDDPSQGGDHVDTHRAPFVLVSPWVKRGYVSKTHIDVASLHKIFAHVFGLPYPNVEVANAALPFDLFTSTPDYTPYTYVPRKHPLTCGTDASWAEEQLTRTWDFSEPDEQPGLDAQVTRYMRGEQYDVLPPALAERVARHRARP